MKIIVCDNYSEISSAAAEIVAEQIKSNPKSVLGLATGSTPVGMYEQLAEMNKNSKIDFKDVITFNLDEYYPISADNPQSYRYFMNKNLFSKINIDIDNTHILNGMCDNTDEECIDFEKMIQEQGGIDLQVLGIGQNGHIGFNEPSESLNSRTHLTDLTENTIEANSRFFDNISDVPRQALTMGIGTILSAKKIILLASGSSKYKAVKELMSSKISTDNPASMLKVHPDVTLICDKEAYSNNRIGVDIGGTEIKFGVLDESDNLIYRSIIPTNTESEDALINSVIDKCKEIIKDYCITGVGVGTPGIIKNGLVSAANLPFTDTDLSGKLEEALKLPVKISNDANCAALAESKCGSGKNYKSLIMISLGTGIGGGIIINNQIYEGSGKAGEIGHFVIDYNGKNCPCGMKGCWEQYASTSVLLKNAELAAENAPESYLADLYRENSGKINGKLFFKALKNDCFAAKKVFSDYIGYLSSGILSLINIFDPDIIVLAGGITNAGDDLLIPLREKISTDVPIEISDLKGDAGTVGAALLI